MTIRKKNFLLLFGISILIGIILFYSRFLPYPGSTVNATDATSSTETLTTPTIATTTHQPAEITPTTIQSGELNETYPEHPRIVDCENLKTILKNFCYDDVAEISGKIEICEKISDEDIKNHCIARVTLNETKCCEVFDEGLREGCRQSIKFKRSFFDTDFSLIPCSFTPTTTVTTTTTLSCRLYDVKITTDCLYGFCSEWNKVYMVGKLNGAHSCANANVFQIAMEDKNCIINLSGDCVSDGLTSMTDIAPPYTSVKGEWTIEKIPENCLGETVTSGYASLWKIKPLKKEKISQSPNPIASGNFSFRNSYPLLSVSTINSSDIDISRIKILSKKPNLVFDKAELLSNICTDISCFINSSAWSSNGVYLLVEALPSTSKNVGVVLIHPRRGLYNFTYLSQSINELPEKSLLFLRAGNVAKYLYDDNLLSNTCLPDADSILNVVITNRDNNESEIVFSDVFDWRDGWRDVALNISKFSNKNLTFTLMAYAGGPGSYWCGEFAAVDEFWIGEYS